MTKYIDANKIKYRHGVAVGKDLGGLRAIALKRDIDDMPAADVVEREKIDKAIEEMQDNKFDGKTVLTYNDAINDCIKILDKLIAESEEM